MASEKHVVMKHSLAKALLDSGVQHLDLGGAINSVFGGNNNYQSSAPTIDQQDFFPGIGKAWNQQAGAYDAQKALADKILSGNQPSVAQTQLATATGNNVSNIASALASGRGASANPGLTAELAARAGGNILQQGAGQAATLGAQEDIAKNTLGAQILQNQAENSNQLFGIEQSGLAAQNAARTTGQLGSDQINASAAQNNANASGQTGGSLLSSIGQGLGAIFNKGGRVPHFADGGIATYATPIDPRIILNVGKPEGKGTAGGIDSLAALIPKKNKQPNDVFQIQGDNSADSSLGVNTAMPEFTGTNFPGVVGNAPAIPELMPQFGSSMSGSAAGPSLIGAEGLMLSSGGAADFRSGGDVPGKAKVSGDNPKNDTVPAVLSPDEVVLPRSVSMAPDAPERAKKFVEALREKQGSGDGYAKVLKAKASLKDRVERLEKLCSGGMA